MAKKTPPKTPATPPIDPNGKAVAGSIYGLPFKEQDATVVYVPVPWDATTSYGGGTSLGPKAILKASLQMDLFDLDFDRPYAAGLFMQKESATVRAWGKKARAEAMKVIKATDGQLEKSKALQKSLATVNQLSDQVNQWVYEETTRLLEAGKMPVIVGGDHSVPYGAIAAYSEKYEGLGILHFDAHSDTREAYMGFNHSHASIMYNVMENLMGVSKLVQVGIRDFCEEEHTYTNSWPDRIKVFYDRDLAQRRLKGEAFVQVAREIVESLPQQVYISFDIDGLDPRFCPHTGTPVPGGLDFQELLAIVRELINSGRTLVGFDLVEVTPSSDKNDEWDANVAMRLLYKLTAMALASQEIVAKK